MNYYALCRKEGKTRGMYIIKELKEGWRIVKCKICRNKYTISSAELHTGSEVRDGS